MVLHVVLFRPKKGLSDSDRDAMLAALRAAATDIPSVRRFHVGARVTHGAAYESLMSEDYPFAAVIEFDDLDGLKGYLQHPKHRVLGDLFYQFQDAALAYDYDAANQI
jgi:hypothetical protein